MKTSSIAQTVNTKGDSVQGGMQRIAGVVNSRGSKGGNGSRDHVGRGRRLLGSQTTGGSVIKSGLEGSLGGGNVIGVFQVGGTDLIGLKRKFIRCSHCQELGQLIYLASDWLLTLVQPIRSQLACLLTQLLTTTTTRKISITGL